MCNCKNVGFGTYDNCVVMVEPWSGKSVSIDRCLADEIQTLWDAGIKTVASCCGHHKVDQSICVIEEDEGLMAVRGYFMHVQENGIVYFNRINN